MEKFCKFELEDFLSTSGSKFTIEDITDISSLTLDNKSSEGSIEKFKDATEFFKSEFSVDYLEKCGTSDQKWLARNSLCKNFDPLFDGSNICFRTDKADISESAESEGDNKDESNENFVLQNGINDEPSTRDSLGNLLMFHSEVPVDQTLSDDLEAKNVKKLHTADEFKFALKMKELEMEEMHLKNLRNSEIEHQMLLQAKNEKIADLLDMDAKLFYVVEDLLTLCDKLLAKKSLLKESLCKPELDIQTLRYQIQYVVDCDNYTKERCFEVKELLKKCFETLSIYQTNEEKFKETIEIMEKKIVELENMCNMLKMTPKKDNSKLVASNTKENIKVTALKIQIQRVGLKIGRLENSITEAKTKNERLHWINEDLATKLENF